jgi:hypothetical protein
MAGTLCNQRCVDAGVDIVRVSVPDEVPALKDGAQSLKADHQWLTFIFITNAALWRAGCVFTVTPAILVRGAVREDVPRKTTTHAYQECRSLKASDKYVEPCPDAMWLNAGPYRCCRTTISRIQDQLQGVRRVHGRRRLSQLAEATDTRSIWDHQLAGWMSGTIKPSIGAGSSGRGSAMILSCVAVG